MTTAARRGGWLVEHRAGTAAQLHHDWPTVDARPDARAVAFCRPLQAALVLGSAQHGDLVDQGRAARAGVDVARRRSGGGMVLVRPDDPLWVDVWVPSGDPLFQTDVIRAFSWLGETWARALGRVGIQGSTVVHLPVEGRGRGHHGGLGRWHRGTFAGGRVLQRVGGRATRLAGGATAVCFAAAASGEVVAPDGRKVVGLAQRRVRAGARFHGACLGRWDPWSLVDLLAVGQFRRRRALAELGPVAVGVGDLLGGDVPALLASVADAFLEELP